jgi:copper chaperone for superoxide dismutase
VDREKCIIDGTIDGLREGFHGLHIHELGDISDGCERYSNTVTSEHEKTICIFKV